MLHRQLPPPVRATICKKCALEIAWPLLSIDALTKRKAELVKDYESLLAKEEQIASNDELPPAQPMPPPHDVICGPDTPSRQAQLDTVIKQGLRRMEEAKPTYTIAGHDFVLTDQITQAANLLLWAKDWKQMTLDIKAREEVVKTSANTLEAMTGFLSVSAQHLAVLQEQLVMQQDATQKKLSDKQTRCLQLFCLTNNSNDATYDWYKGRLEDRLEGTCQWLLQHDHFTRWLARVGSAVR